MRYFFLFLFYDLHTPGALFRLFFTAELVGQICNFTNQYYKATKELKPALYKELETFDARGILHLRQPSDVLQHRSGSTYRDVLGYSSLFHGLWARTFMFKFRYKQIQTFLKVSRPITENQADKITTVRFLTEYICQSA